MRTPLLDGIRKEAEKEYRFRIPDPPSFMKLYKPDRNTALDFTDYYQGSGQRVREIPSRNELWHVLGSGGDKTKKLITAEEAKKLIAAAQHIATKRGVGEITVGGLPGYAEYVNDDLQVEVEGDKRPDTPRNWQEIGSVYDYITERRENKMNTPLLNGISKKSSFPLLFTGGRRKDFGNLPIQPTIGYTNLFGLVPWPDISLRVGSRTGAGISLGTAGLGFSSRRSHSFRDRFSPKGLLDIAIESIENKRLLNKIKEAEGA